MAPTKNAKNSEDFTVLYRGGFTICCGIAARISQKMLNKADESETTEP